MSTAEIHYKVPWRAAGSFPGHHASVQKGGGLSFRNHVPLIDAPDPRRFDVRASLRDPFERIQVRVYQQTSAIPVFVVADLSASMSFSGRQSKADTLTQLVASVAYSAYRTGDTFGFVGCGEQVSESLFLPPTLNRAAGAELAQRLATEGFDAPNADGLLRAADLLGGRRALVFLVSDFHFAISRLELVLASLALHDVVPVMLWDHHEYRDLPDYGLARVRDPETRASRLLLLRPGLKKRIEASYVDRRQQLDDVFGRYGRQALLLVDGFDSDEVTRYFFG